MIGKAEVSRCFIDPGQWDQPEIALAPEESHHLARVLRIRPGDAVMLVDGQGHQARAEVITVRSASVRVRINANARSYTPPPAVPITLIQALPKHALMDWIIQKATELGVRAIWPVITERVVTQIKGRVAEDRCQRWRKIAREAIKQSGILWQPSIQPVRPISEILPLLPEFSLKLVASLHPSAVPFSMLLKNLPCQTGLRPALIIGPEGDLSDEETAALHKAGGLLVRFGQTILRVETAALYGLSVLKNRFDETDPAPGLGD